MAAVAGAAAMNGPAYHERAYLFGRVGPFGLLFPAAQVARVWAADVGAADGAAVTDLRRLFGLDATRAGPRVCLDADGGKTGIIVVDQVASLHMLTDEDFQPLPTAFQYARTVFDAVCTEPVEGVFGLRLRRNPQFEEMTGWSPAGRL
jgi:hypothetical protein